MDQNPGLAHDTTTRTATPTTTTSGSDGGDGSRFTTERFEAIIVDTDNGDGRSWVRRITGSAVWSGFAVGFAVWVLLELFLAAIDLVPLGISGSGFDASELWWSGAASVVALFVGGLVAGAGGRSRRATDGALQGIVTWAVTTVAIVVLVAIGAGVGFGALGASLNNAENQSNISLDQQQQAEDQGFVLTQGEAEESAGVGALFLGLTVVAAAAGGMLGAAMARTNDDNGRDRDRTTAVRR